MKSEEVNYKKNFCEKYFDKGSWDLDVLNQVDVLLKDKKQNYLLYIETKFIISNETLLRQARAQVILTNKKQTKILSRVALVYQDAEKNDVLELINCSENSVMYNNDINWNSEKPSMPTKDAIDRINDRIYGKITTYKNDEIKEFYRLLKTDGETVISITEKNFNVIYNQWKNEVLFKEKILDEQDLINLFLVDILNGTKYKKSFISDDMNKAELFENQEQELIREGTNLSHYKLMFIDEQIDGIKYTGESSSLYYTISDVEKYNFFWKKYKRPPEKHEFLKILERSSTLYSDKYRKDTGGEYTPTCFVQKQVEILNEHYNMNDFIVFDPCAGVGNLENQFGKDFKQYCYLSTLEQMDVDICKIKGFENSMQFDYLKNAEEPKFKYKGSCLDITEIAHREGKKLMIVMNPPYQRKKEFKNDLAIEFFNKVVKLQPQVIVYYCKTEFFLRDSIKNYIDSKYKIVSHIFSNAKDTFKLSEWAVSLVVFDKEKGDEIKKDFVNTDRYDFDEKQGKLNFIKSYKYDNSRPDLIKEIEKEIKKNMQDLIIGQYCYLNSVLKISNGGKEKSNKITAKNIKWCLLSKGLNFNTHHKYYEWNYLVYRGYIKDIPLELYNDAIMFSLFYKGILFTNKKQKNYIMPFTAEELGCEKNDLNVLFPQNIEQDLFNQEEEQKPFDFRVFLRQFDFSKEAKDLYNAALQIFKYYHKNENIQDKDWNDSFYDITNAIMGKDATSFSEYEGEKDTRISKVKTTKGTKGFGRNTIKYAVSSKDLTIFEHFFDVRDVLAKKINKQLVENHLLLWERENIY